MSKVNTAATPTPEELALAVVRQINDAGHYLVRHKHVPDAPSDIIAAAIRQHSEAQRAEIERLRVMADEPTTKRVWDGIQAMAGLFADPDHMPTVLEFKAAFDAAFVVDGKPYDVERIKAEWQADYAAMEARATTAEAALAAARAKFEKAAQAHHRGRERMEEALAASQERERKMREALEEAKQDIRRVRDGIAFVGRNNNATAAIRKIDAAIQQQETADVR